jgi:hypothetical protein
LKPSVHERWLTAVPDAIVGRLNAHKPTAAKRSERTFANDRANISYLLSG